MPMSRPQLATVAPQRAGPYQYFMLALCALALILLAILAFGSVAAETTRLIVVAHRCFHCICRPMVHGP